jgi:hypothetical protein
MCQFIPEETNAINNSYWYHYYCTFYVAKNYSENSNNSITIIKLSSQYVQKLALDITFEKNVICDYVYSSVHLTLNCLFCIYVHLKFTNIWSRFITNTN